MPSIKKTTTNFQCSNKYYLLSHWVSQTLLTSNIIHSGFKDIIIHKLLDAFINNPLMVTYLFFWRKETNTSAYYISTWSSYNLIVLKIDTFIVNIQVLPVFSFNTFKESSNSWSIYVERSIIDAMDIVCFAATINIALTNSCTATTGNGSITIGEMLDRRKK